MVGNTRGMPTKKSGKAGSLFDPTTHDVRHPSTNTWGGSSPIPDNAWDEENEEKFTELADQLKVQCLSMRPH